MVPQQVYVSQIKPFIFNCKGVALGQLDCK